MYMDSTTKRIVTLLNLYALYKKTLMYVYVCNLFFNKMLTEDVG